MKKLFTISLFLCLAFANGQPPKRFFTKFGSDGDDVGYSAKVTLDKQYIIAGMTSGWGNGNTDVMLAKMDTMGQVIWLKTYGGFSNDIGKSVVQLADGSYVIAGFTNSFGAGGYDAYLIKTDVNGNLIWQTTFGGDDWDFANDLVEAADGSIWVVGNTSSFGNGKKDGFVLKYDIAGNLQWQKYHGGAENEELRAIIRTNDNLIGTVGYTESRGDINGDGYFAKLNLNGDTVFTRSWGGPYKDVANDLTQKSSGDYIFCGAKTFSANGTSYAYMCSYSLTGEFIWDNSYKHNNSDNEEFVTCANSTMLDYVTGYIRNVRFPVNKMQGQMFAAIHGGWPYKVNESGGGDDEYLYSTENTPDGGYISVGSTTSFGSVGKDVYFIKNDSTIINYTSIVSVPETDYETTQPLIRTTPFWVSVEFADARDKTVEVLDLNGKILRYRRVSGKEEVVFEAEDLLPSVYLIRVRYANGQLYHEKFIKN